MRGEFFITTPLDLASMYPLEYRDVDKKLRYIYLLSAFLLLFVCSKVQSQWLDDPVLDQRVMHGIDKLYNYEFDRADSDFTDVIRLRPDHPAGYYQ